MSVMKWVLCLGLAMLDGCVYAVGGWEGTARLDSIERYHRHSNAWTFVAPMKMAVTSPAVVAHDGLLYVTGKMAVTSPVFVAHDGKMAVTSPVVVAHDGKMAVTSPVVVGHDGKMAVTSPVVVAHDGKMAVTGPAVVAHDIR